MKHPKVTGVSLAAGEQRGEDGICVTRQRRDCVAVDGCC